MNVHNTNRLLVLTITFLTVMLMSGIVLGKSNDKSARGQDNHRTWVIYEAYPDPRQDVQLEEGDAFRLTIPGGEGSKFKLKPLRKLMGRWDINPGMIDLKEVSDSILCGEIRLKNQSEKHEYWLIIETVGDDLLNLYWSFDGEGCHHTESHPGHAKAEN